MAEIAAFLEERLAEDEELARTADAEPIPDDGFERGTHIVYGLQSTGIGLDYQGFALVWDPARVLREVAAKRRVLERHRPASHPNYRFGGTGPTIYMCEGCGYDTNWCGEHEPRTEDINDCPELRDIAAIYADHEDYAPKWSETP